jgi:hypothetical protein
MAYTNIDKGSDYFETVTYTGTGAEQSISSLNFSPDLTWIKNRDTTDSHQLVDSVRGATKNLFSNLTNAEATDAEGLKSFDTDGFTVGTRLGMNTSGESYVGWSWRGSDSSAVSNTDGSITSTVSANTTSGFSIVSYTGSGATATVGHGLSSAPAMIIIKSREDPASQPQHWIVYHQSLGNTSYQWLSRDIATGTSILGWNNTSPTSSVFSLGNGWTPNNYSGTNYIAYCFAEKKGFSKFGSYTGNGSTDGTFVYTGFKPAFVIIKQTDEARDWLLMDNKRLGYNPKSYDLHPNTSDIEDTNDRMDLLSNGFKQTTIGSANNKSGATYIYMAFASNPFVTSTGVPTTAR